jgi:hypothetical protein
MADLEPIDPKTVPFDTIRVPRKRVKMFGMAFTAQDARNAQKLVDDTSNAILARCFGVQRNEHGQSLIRGEKLLAKLNEGETPQFDCDYLAEEVTKAPPGSGDRVAALSEYYASSEGVAGISPFEEEAGTVAVELLHSPNIPLARKENLHKFLKTIGVCPE